MPSQCLVFVCGEVNAIPSSQQGKIAARNLPRVAAERPARWIADEEIVPASRAAQRRSDLENEDWQGTQQIQGLDPRRGIALLMLK